MTMPTIPGVGEDGRGDARPPPAKFPVGKDPGRFGLTKIRFYQAADRIGTVDLVDASRDIDKLAAMVDQTPASYEMAAGRSFLQYLLGMALTEMGFDVARRP